MVTLGIGMGAMQFIPLFESAQYNFRSERSDFQTVLDWAHKSAT